MKSSTTIALSPMFKRLLFGFVVFNVLVGLVGIWLIIDSFHPPDLYKKDFIQEYLMAKATLNGVDPYSPLPKLAEKWAGGSEFIQLNHPTPHPPLVGVVFLPLGLLDYQTSALSWLFFELACLLASICLIVRWWGRPLKPGIVLLTFFFALCWIPVFKDLWYGQLSICLLLLLLCAWLALHDGKNALGGALLGGMIALKLAAWPIVLFLALRRKWSGVLAAAAIVLTTHLAAIIVLGFTTVKDYYLKIGPMVSSIYRVHDGNFSTWTLGRRLFDEFGLHFVTRPLWASPSAAHFLTFFVPLVLLIFGLALALKAKQFDTSFGILVIVWVLVNPVAWTYYLIFAVIPIIITVRRIGAISAPRKILYATFVICMLMSTDPGMRVAAALLFSTQTTSNGVAIVPLWAGAITLIPTIAGLGAIVILWKTDRIEISQRANLEVNDEPGELPKIEAIRKYA